MSQLLKNLLLAVIELLRLSSLEDGLRIWVGQRAWSEAERFELAAYLTKYHIDKIRAL